MVDNRENRIRRRRRVLLWVLGATVLLLLAIIVSQQLWLWTVVRPDTPADALVLYALSTLNFVAFVVFLFIFVRNLLKLRRERRERQLGSKVKTRLLVYFISISFLPITAMAFFSYLFLNRSLEKWFNPFPDEIVQQATEVKRLTLSSQDQTLRDTASLLVMLLNGQSPEERVATMDQIVNSGQLVGIEIIRNDGLVETQSRAPLSATDAEQLDKLFGEARKFRGPSNSLVDGKEFDALAVPLNQSEMLIIAPQKRASNDLTDLVTDSERGYQNLVGQQRRVRLLGLSTLGLMTLILLFVSSWVAIYLARGIATPIKALAEASNEVARGNLAHRVTTTIADDELALLAESFNQMTAQLQENRSRIEAGASELRDTNMALRERRNYIETVLQSLSTGVVSIDENDCVTTLNASAARMLALGERADDDPKLSGLIGSEDWLVVDRLLRRARRTGHATEQTQLESGGANGPLPVSLTATALRGSKGPRRGVVLVIEDLSELLAAQRAAAWSEVARRMAHEIKNPLTPIQLSAERIAKSYRRATANGNGAGEHADEKRVAAVISECTETITREVAGLKAMVDEFSRFARLPATRLDLANLNDVISQAAGLYVDHPDGVALTLDLDCELPPSMLDVEQIKRVFVNLIDNAVHALVSASGEKQITIATSHDAERSLLRAEVADTGHGIEPGDFRRLFEPYFSRRDSGTGLGLAIVQRIIMEHGGHIRAERNHPRGARFVIELPV